MTTVGFVGICYYSFLSILFVVTFLSSVKQDRSPLDRLVDVIVGIVIFAMFEIYVFTSGSVIR